MAEPELKKLNKNVEEAVNILKFYVGNSAQAKNLSEKQKEAISKWFDVLDKEEEQVKQQRAFTERERDANGRFRKKFEFSLMGIADAVTGIFTGMAKGIISSIKGLTSGITKHLGNFFNAVKSHFLGLFGEESEWFNILSGIWESTKGFFGWFVRGFLILFKKTPKWATKMIDILGNMFDLQIKQMKMEYLQPGGKKKKGGIMAALGFALFAAAALFAGWLKARLIALNSLWKSFKLTKLFQWIRLKYLKFATKFKKFFGFFGKITAFLEKMPILGRVLRGLKYGLKFLGWPITLLLGIIDFIKGWRESTGDWQDKLKTGFKSVINGLIDLPLKILGWALDWVMEKLGLGDWIPEGGMGNKLKVWAGNIMDWLLKWGPVGMLLDVIKALTTEGGFKKVFEPKIKALQDTIGKLFDIISGVWNAVIQWVSDKARSLPFGLGNSVSKWIENLKAENNKPPTSPPDNLPEKLGKMERQKREEQIKNARDIKESVDKQTEATKQSQAKTDGAINAITGINQGGGGGSIEQKQIPDEIDNYIIAVKDNAMDFD